MLSESGAMAGSAVKEGGFVLADELARHGAQFVFSVSGGPINSIYHGAAAAGLRLIHTRHEAAAGYMADGISRVGGSIGVCVVTLGPGVTNVVTPALTARRASVPVLFIGGQAPESALWREPGMAADVISVMAPVTKWTARIPMASQIPAYVDRAFAIMMDGRPGPVFLEAPVDVLSAQAAASTIEPAALDRSGGSGQDMSAVADALTASKRAVALIGDQAYWGDARAELLRLVESMNIPFAQLRLARGLLPESHELNLGPGYVPANSALRVALSESDLVLLIGHEFEFDLDYGSGIRPGARVAQIHPARERLHVNREAQFAVESQVAPAIRALLALSPSSNDPEWAAAACRAWRDEWQQTLDAAAGEGPPLHPIRAIAEVSNAVGDDAVFVTSHGNVDFWADAHLRFNHPGRYLRAGQAGALGAELPYGVAASLAHPDRPVIVFVGDGGVGYHVTELDTAARYGAHPVVVVLDDGKWGAIALPQAREYGSEVEMSLPTRDWPVVAGGLGAAGFHAETPSEIADAIADAVSLSVPALVRVPVQSVESPYMRYITGG